MALAPICRNAEPMHFGDEYLGVSWALNEQVEARAFRLAITRLARPSAAPAIQRLLPRHTQDIHAA